MRSGQKRRPPVSTDGSGVYEVTFALEKGGDMAEELPGETVYPCEGIFKISRLFPDAGSP